MMNIISVKVSVTCPFCGKESFLTLSANDFNAWQNGELVQNAFPYLDANERELLVSGICSECWEKTFSTEEDEEDSPEWHDTCDEEEEEDSSDDYWFEGEEEDSPDDYWLEDGFNPYMGCYDYDC